MQTTAAKANPQLQTMKNPQPKKLKAQGFKLLIALPCFNNLEFSVKTWQDKKKNHRQNNQQQRQQKNSNLATGVNATKTKRPNQSENQKKNNNKN